jgi:Protein of unknown function (DUF3592)
MGKRMANVVGYLVVAFLFAGAWMVSPILFGVLFAAMFVTFGFFAVRANLRDSKNRLGAKSDDREDASDLLRNGAEISFPPRSQREGGSSMRGWQWWWSWSRSGGVSRVGAIIAAIAGLIIAIAVLIPAVVELVVELRAGRVRFADTLQWGLFAGIGGFGGLFLVIGILSFVSRRRFVSLAASAIGVVTDFESAEMQSIYPTVRFQSHDGRMLEFTSDTYVPKGFSYDPGGQVEVLYNPSNPEEAHIKTFYMLWFIPLFCSGFGAFCLVLGGVVLVF